MMNVLKSGYKTTKELVVCQSETPNWKISSNPLNRFGIHNSGTHTNKHNIINRDGTVIDTPKNKVEQKKREREREVQLGRLSGGQVF